MKYLKNRFGFHYFQKIKNLPKTVAEGKKNKVRELLLKFLK